MNFLQQISSKVESMNLLQIILYIFTNNIKSAFIVLFLGFAFGVIPLFALITNGYLLGFVVNYAFNREGIFILWKIFPHGIFELPAVLISIAIGLKLGFNVLNRKFKFKEYFLRSIRFFISVVIPLLVIAALIEGSLIYFLR
jgi:stage II sporulation protein M